MKIISGRESSAEHELVFKAENIPPVGFKSFYISKNSEAVQDQVVIGNPLPSSGRQAKTILGFNDDNFKLVFNNKNGKIMNIIQNGKVKTVEQTFGYYEGHPGNNSKFEFRAVTKLHNLAHTKQTQFTQHTLAHPAQKTTICS